MAGKRRNSANDTSSQSTEASLPQESIITEVQKDTVQPAVMVEEEVEYEVESILDKRVLDNDIQYLLKWRGYPATMSTWEPKKHLNCFDLIRKFERKLSKIEASRKKNRTQDEPTKQRKRKSQIEESADSDTIETLYQTPSVSQIDEANTLETESSTLADGQDAEDLQNSSQVERIVNATDMTGELMFLVKL